MTILIAHRALFEGPNPANENHPAQIIKALDAGYQAEIDVRYIDGEWWLGHDGPTYKVDDVFLTQQGLWIHAKNIEALMPLRRLSHSVNYFWHQEDDVAVTSHGWIWTYPGRPLVPEHSVLVQPEWFDNWRETIKTVQVDAICTKYVKEIVELRK